LYIHVVVTYPEEFDWDPVKNEANPVKHGVSFEEASHIFFDPILTRVDNRQDYTARTEISALGRSPEIPFALSFIPPAMALFG